MTATNDGIIHLKGRIRDGKLVALLDHEGKELGAPVTSIENEFTGGSIISQGDTTQQFAFPGDKTAVSHQARQSSYGKRPGTVAVDWSQCTISGVAANWTVAVDTAVLYAGMPTLRVTATTGTPGNLGATITLPAGLYLGAAKRIHSAIIASDRALAGDNAAPLQVRFNYSAGTFQTFQIYTGPSSWDGEDWNVGTARNGDANTTGHTANTTQWPKVGPNALAELTSSISLVQSAAGISGPVTQWIAPIFTDQITPPILSIFMDGNYASQYTFMRAALERANLRASMAIVVPNVGNGASYMTLAQIGKMYDAGHECVRHTGAGAVVGWNDTTKYPDLTVYETVKADCDAYRTWAVANGFTRGLGYGVVGIDNGMVKSQALSRRNSIAQAIYDSGERHVRTLTTAVSTYDTHFEHVGHVPLFKTAVYQVRSTTTTANIDTVITELKSRGGWSGITFHTAVLDSAVPAGNDVGGVVLDYTMAAIATEVANGNIICLPFSEAMAELALPNLVAP